MNNLTKEKIGASAKAIEHHYDLSNDFYQLWLDSTCTYSSALWRENDNLESAQLRKIDFHIDQARAKGAKRVLDVGCGWGGTLKRLVEVHGVERVVGLTLSKAQAEWITSFNQPKIEVKLENWSNHFPQDPYDAIISIGAFEHFANPKVSKAEKVEGYRTFFRNCHQWLKPGGWMSLQTIAYGNGHPEKMNQFIGNDIFPESDIPSLVDIIQASAGLFEIVALHNHRQDYERTCKIWLSQLKANRTAAINLVGKPAVARYEKYLSFSSIGFHIGTIILLRIALRRLDSVST